MSSKPKEVPHHVEAERALLGALLLENAVWDQVADLIDHQDFYQSSHQIIFKVVREMQMKAHPVDLITVSNLLQTRNEIQLIGGPQYLVDLVSQTISTANCVAHAKLIRQKSLVRKVITTAQDVVECAYSEDFLSVEEFLDQTEERFYKLSENQISTGLVHPMEVVKQSLIKLEDLYKNRADVTGLPTGFTNLDRMTSGLHPGELTIIAARPSMGKTALSLNVAQHLAIHQKKTVAYFSLEMSREAVMMRILASEAKVNMKDLRSGKIADDAWPKLIEVAGKISDTNLFIDETTTISPFEIRARTRRLKARHGLDVILIDYLQMMKMKDRTENREREVSEISRSLKALAKELGIPVVALAQLNRGVEGRTEKRPMLSDLRESGSIEQDADVIMMLYREDYYDREDPEKQGRAELIIGKHRNGPTGTVKLHFDAEFGRFRDADPSISAPPLPPPPPPTLFRPRNFAPGQGRGHS